MGLTVPEIEVGNPSDPEVTERAELGGVDVIFSEENHSVLLGPFTLEALGLALDPLKGELNRYR